MELKRIIKRIAIASAITIFAIPVFIILLVIALGFYDHYDNNGKLKDFSEQLFSYPLPPKTTQIGKSTFVGNTGNSDHCDFSATEILETQLTLEEIENYYRKGGFKKADGYESLFDEAYVFVHEDRDISIDNKFVVDVSIVDQGHSARFDIRCF